MYGQQFDRFHFIEGEKVREKSELKRYGILGGICVLGFLLMQELLFLLLYALGLGELYSSDTLFRQAAEMFITIFAICTPFLLCGAYEKKFTSYEILPLDKPKDTALSVLAVPAGVALCLIGSYLTAYLTLFLESLGLTLTSPQVATPTSGFEAVIYFMRLTIVAAVIEEISFRGVIMQPLRKYGDIFAVTMAAIIFGLVHCNLIQAPFAFVAGLAIGYFTVTTGSLWTGIFIHMLNNAISGVISLLADICGDKVADIAGSIIIFAVIFIGIICLALFFLRRGGISTYGKKSCLSKGEKAKAYLINLPMILAFIAICWYTHYYVSL